MKLTKEKKSFLDSVVKGNWSVNPDTGLVDVDGSVYMGGCNLKKIPVKFGNVSGCFDCDYNELKSLKSSPQSVGKHFFCSYNQLISLEGAPQSVGGYFNCRHNNLTSLVGAPQSVGDYFFIELNYIDKAHYYIIIPEIEEMMERDVKLYRPNEYYYPYKEAYYNAKLVDVL
jgi:hypothetical protein